MNLMYAYVHNTEIRLFQAYSGSRIRKLKVILFQVPYFLSYLNEYTNKAFKRLWSLSL